MGLVRWLLRLFTKPRPPVKFLPHHFLRLAAVEVARAEMGAGATEEGGNNMGRWVRKYTGGKEGSPWCAAFISWVFEQASRNVNQPLPFKRSHGAKRLYKNVGKAGRFLSTPKKGAVVCWHRGRKGSWKGHVGIVSHVFDNGSFATVEGNRGGYPSRVAVYEHEVDEGGLIGFAVID